MNKKRILWQVDVHRENSYDSYRVIAPDDRVARARAIKADDKFADNEAGEIVYCEIEIVSHIDV